MRDRDRNNGRKKNSVKRRYSDRLREINTLRMRGRQRDNCHGRV